GREERGGDERVDRGLVSTAEEERRPLPAQNMHRLQANDRRVGVHALRVHERRQAKRNRNEDENAKSVKPTAHAATLFCAALCERVCAALGLGALARKSL